MDKETYTRSTLSVGDVSITIYIHESLTPEQALNRLVEHYKAWCVNMPGGRRQSGATAKSFSDFCISYWETVIPDKRRNEYARDYRQYYLASCDQR
jgi:hypothetical protein